MKAKDIWMNWTTEALDNIKLIKFNSWIDRFIKFVNEARMMELKWLSKRFAMSVSNFGIISFTYPMLSLVTFATSILVCNHKVSLAAGVAGLQVIQLLQAPSRWLPYFIGMIIQFLVSIKWINKFLLCDEVDEDLLKRIQDHTSDGAVKIDNQNFFWGFSNADDDELEIEKRLISG